MSEFFDNREDEYLRWTEAHRDDGYIVNVGGGFPPKAHLASRRCVTGAARSNYTTHEYKKDCSTDLSELQGKYGSALTYCRLCFPGGCPHATRPTVAGTASPRPSVVASRIVERLIVVYRDQTIPQMVGEFSGWGFSADALRSHGELLHTFIVLAAYDRRPYAGVGGYERVWSDEPRSLRQVLDGRGLLDVPAVTALTLKALDASLADARFGGLSLQTDRGAGSAQGTIFARTIKEIAAASRELHARVLGANTSADAEALFRSFDDIHGIGPTIASKLCKYLLREMGLGSVPPLALGRCAQPILAEYHNTAGYQKLAHEYGAETTREVLAGLAASADPYAIDAIFFINRFRAGDFSGLLGNPDDVPHGQHGRHTDEEA